MASDHRRRAQDPFHTDGGMIGVYAYGWSSGVIPMRNWRGERDMWVMPAALWGAPQQATAARPPHPEALAHDLVRPY